MRIYSMTATFGKLEHQTLTLEPGLNIIEAPNEWGKSTWCAFLIDMLYGIDTRAKTTKNVLADKDKYTPWSGSPMTGRIDLNWNGRDITIERRTKGRSIFGDFRAYETASGLNVPELTAADCGQQLLGVEKSVFTRAGFLKLADLPVTQDDSLRRRLNALVTTGDESDAGDALAQKLKDLKNRCRHNRTGLLPQAEMQQADLKSKYDEIQSLKQQKEQLLRRHKELEDYRAQLENHRIALEFAATKSDALQVEKAISDRDEARKQFAAAQQYCNTLPSRQQAEQELTSIRDIQQQLLDIQMESQMLPKPPQIPEIPTVFQGLSPENAVSQAKSDTEYYHTLQPGSSKSSPLLWILASVLLVTGITFLFIQTVPGIILLGAGVLCLTAALIRQSSANHSKAQAEAEMHALAVRYGSVNPEDWLQSAQNYTAAQTEYHRAWEVYQQTRADVDRRSEALARKVSSLVGSSSLQERQTALQQVISAWNALDDTRRDLQRASNHADAMQAMVKTAQAPQFPDSMTFTEAETARLLSDTLSTHRQLQLQLGECQGKMDSLGEESLILKDLDAVNRRISRLEETYTALEIAQNTLAEATSELQRRFAPKIASRAQELFTKLTGSRYDRLTLGEDLSLSTGTKDEATIRSILWRSDGTADQLYLALRLAVAEELTPDSPLILDDAFVRFDDKRLATALDILRDQSQNRQILLFTCQSREKEIIRSFSENYIK